MVSSLNLLRPLRSSALRVPEITVYFWIIKSLTTAMGESTSDFSVQVMNPVLAVGIGFIGFVGALLLQLWVGRYFAPVYWLTVVMVGVFGTMAADVMHVAFHVPYLASAALYLAILVAVFTLWQKTERTLSMHSIDAPRRELFYWSAVVSTFALGTATGDLTAMTLHLGYLLSAVLFAVAICIPAVGYWKFKLDPVLAFWASYVLTRPLGASVADWLGKPRSVGGLGVGDGPVALALTIVIMLLVGYLTVTRTDVQSANPDRRATVQHATWP